MSAPTKGPYFLHQDDGKMSIYPETWKGKPNREAMLALMATVSPWDGASQHDRSEVMAQAVANGHLLAASWSMREALEQIITAMALEELDESSAPMLRRFDELRDKARAALAAARGERHEG